LAWTIRLETSAEKDLARLDKPVARRLRDFLKKRVAKLDNPRSIGESLKGLRFGELWRYRVGDYRIICHIKDTGLVVLALRIGHRKDIYNSRP
jgi:mRNA interferase RelE/StbE